MSNLNVSTHNWDMICLPIPIRFKVWGPTLRHSPCLAGSSWWNLFLFFNVINVVTTIPLELQCLYWLLFSIIICWVIWNYDQPILSFPKSYLTLYVTFTVSPTDRAWIIGGGGDIVDTTYVLHLELPSLAHIFLENIGTPGHNGLTPLHNLLLTGHLYSQHLSLCQTFIIYFWIHTFIRIYSK